MSKTIPTVIEPGGTYTIEDIKGQVEMAAGMHSYIVPASVKATIHMENQGKGRFLVWVEFEPWDVPMLAPYRRGEALRDP